MKKTAVLILALTLSLLALVGLTACSSVEFKVNFVVDGEVYDTITTAGNEAIQIPENPVKEGYTFEGWYTDPAFSAGSKVSFPYTPTANVTLYAKWSVNFTEGLQMTLQISTNTYIVTGYTGVESVITIPETYNGLNVTGINARAFEGNTMITKVIIADSIITVGLGAFSECYNLEYVDMSDNVQLLGASAFSNCIKLKSIDLPDTLQNIGGEAFFGCAKLEELYLSSQLVNIGTNIVRGCNSLKKLTLPGRITLMSLVGDTNDNIPATLEEIYIAPGSAEICENMLLDCAMVKKITAPSSVTTIGANAFKGCSALTTVTLSGIITSIGNSAFYDCAAINSVYIKDVETWCAITFGDDYANPMRYANKLYILDSVTPITNLVIPGGVTSIPAYAFSSEAIESVIIPDSVTSISERAFYNCNKLKSLVIGNGISSLPAGLLYDCSFLESLTIPFVGSSKSAATASSSTLFGYIFGTSSYDGGVATKQYYSDSSSSYATYYIPSTLKSVTITGGNILYGAFYNCNNLTSVTIGNGVTSIGSGALSGCSKLEDLTLPFVGSLFGYIFGTSSYDGGIATGQRYAASSYVTYYIPSTLKSVTITGGNILGWAFYNCNNITSVTIGNGVTSIGYEAFYSCTSLTSVTIGNGVTSIGEDAFEYCTSLDKVYISDIAKWCAISFDSNDANPLYYADKLYMVGSDTPITNLVIPEGVTSIGVRAFYDCDSLTSVTIPNSVTSIGDYAFQCCYKLVEVYDLSSSITVTKGSSNYGYIGGYALNVYTPTSGTSKLNTTSDGYIFYEDGNTVYLVNYTGNSTTLTLPDKYNGKNYAINKYAFYNNDKITSVTIPDSVTSIGSYAFYSCDSLTNINVDAENTAYKDINGNLYTKDGATLLQYAIGKSATTFSIPNGVTSIGEGAFSGCDSLRSVTIPDSVTSIGDSAFWGCTSLTSVTIPDSVTSIGDWAFYSCNSLTNVTIGNGVTSIGSDAFYSCDSLTSVTFKNPNGWWRSTSSSATSGTSITNLSNTSTAATYLKSTYEDYYWRRG